MLRHWLALGLGVSLALGGCQPDAAPTTAPTSPGANADVETPGEETPDEAAGLAPSVTHPMRRLDSAHIVLPVILPDGKSVDFILDSGASVSVITPKTRDAFGFSASDGVEVAGQGAGGSLGDVRLLVLPQITVGQQTYAKHDAAVMNLTHLEEKIGAKIGGILGRNFLRKHLIELDFAADKIVLHDPATTLEELDDLEVIPFESFAAGGLIKIKVALDDGAEMPAVLDIGAGRSVINWKAAKKAGVTDKSKKLRPSKEPLLGADNKPIKTATYRFGQLRVGHLTIQHPELFLADLPVFKTLQIHEAPAMVFGIDMFAGRRLFLDDAGKRILVSRNAAD